MGMMAAVPTLDRCVQHAPPRMTEVWGMECKWPRRETQIEVGEKKQSSEDPTAPDLCAPQAESGNWSQFRPNLPRKRWTHSSLPLAT
jgi:hypothetical protein